MDQKGTEGKMLAITDGRDDDSRGSSSYAMLPSDRKAVAETRSSASKSEIQIAEAKKSFAKSWLLPEGLLLWWDAKGIFKTSKRDEVINHMEKHRKFYEAVVTFTVMVEKGDKGSYELLLDLYEELSEMEVEARSDAKSKAICRMLKDFLDEKYKLDHNLKRVECVVLRQKIDNVEKSCERYRTAVSDIGEDMRKLREENREMKELMKESHNRAEKLQAENETCKSMVEAMQRRMEELSLESDRRAEEASKRSEARIQKMAEQNQRELQKISKLLASMTGGSNSERNLLPDFP